MPGTAPELIRRRSQARVATCTACSGHHEVCSLNSHDVRSERVTAERAQRRPSHRERLKSPGDNRRWPVGVAGVGRGAWPVVVVCRTCRDQEPWHVRCDRGPARSVYRAMPAPDPEDASAGFDPRPRTPGSWAHWASCRSATGCGCSTSPRGTRWTRWHPSGWAQMHEHPMQEPAGSRQAAGGSLAAEWPPRILKATRTGWDPDGLHEGASAGQRHFVR